MINKHYAQIAILFVALVAAVVKEIVERRAKSSGREVGYRPFVVQLSLISVAAIFGVVIELSENGSDLAEREIRDGIRHVEVGRSTMNNSLERDRPDADPQTRREALAQLSHASADLEDGIAILDRYRHRGDAYYALLMARHDQALIEERQAYGLVARGCRYYVSGNAIHACFAPRGSHMHVNPSFGSSRLQEQFHTALFKCTDIENNGLWRSARHRYEQLEATLLTQRPPTESRFSSELELASAARSLAYFQLCDQMRFGEDRTVTARAAIQLAGTSSDHFPERRADAHLREEFIDVLDRTQVQPAPINCDGEACAQDIDE